MSTSCPLLVSPSPSEKPKLSPAVGGMGDLPGSDSFACCVQVPAGSANRYAAPSSPLWLGAPTAATPPPQSSATEKPKKSPGSSPVSCARCVQSPAFCVNMNAEPGVPADTKVPEAPTIAVRPSRLRATAPPKKSSGVLGEGVNSACSVHGPPFCRVKTYAFPASAVGGLLPG